jgi:hypothetical protein
MEFKPSCGSEFRANSRGWSWPIRSIVSLMVMIALCSLSLTVLARGMRRQAKPASPVTRTWNVPQKPVLPPKAAAPGVPARVMPVPRTDKFAIVADPAIDPEMVVTADPAIDPKMVFNPEVRGRRPAPIAPVAVPGSRVLPRPTRAPGQINPTGRNQQPR